jgi:hypothetical protein
MSRGAPVFFLVFLFALALLADLAAAQVIMRPGPGANQSGVTVVQPTFTPPYRLTITVYVTAQDGRRLPPPLGANLLVIDGQGRREGMDADGVLRHEIPNARWEPFVVNPAPQAPVGPRGQMGTAVALDDPGDGRYVVEITGTDRVDLDLAVAQWDRAGQRRWLHFLRASTEPGAVDRWELPYTAAARPAFDLREQRDDSYLSVRTYGRRGDSVVTGVTELLLIDPRGRRVGRAPKTRQDFKEIPRANYDSGTGDIEGRELEVMRPAAGAYTLDVTGTAAGAYDVTMYLTDRAGQSHTPLEITNVPTHAGETHRYVLRTDAPPGVGGAFGHGARLLSYAAPTAARTELAAGETGATIVIVYGPTIARESFRATLGGRDVSARFKPAPGASEAVRLPLAPGSSSLVLSVRGRTPDGQTILHSDHLELVRR